jgi:hypothetical protein
MAEENKGFWEIVRSVLNCSCFTDKPFSHEIELTKTLETEHSRNKSNFNGNMEEDSARQT